MQRVVITIVSLLAVLVHVHAGCCAHHDHVTRPTKPAAVACPFHNASDHAHDHGVPPAQPLPHDDCHESHCSVTLVSSASVPQATGSGWWLPPLATVAELTSRDGSSHSASAAADDQRPRPLRAHLLLGVLLI